MIQYGLIGYPLTHSFSPAFFKEKFRKEKLKDVRYDSYPLESLAQLQDLLFQKPEIRGLNVTIPYKESILSYLDDIDPLAKEIGAVNTILVQRGKLIGFNTDVTGFETAVRSFLQPSMSSALVLGSGGSSKAVVFALKRLGITPLVVSRKPGRQQISYSQVDEALLNSHKLIINCTPSGMYPLISQFPSLPYEKLTAGNLLFDLIYNPAETLFLQKGRLQGATTVNGQKMLEYQAEDAWKIWNRED